MVAQRLLLKFHFDVEKYEIKRKNITLNYIKWGKEFTRYIECNSAMRVCTQCKQLS